jgi:phosphate transport system permease protein
MSITNVKPAKPWRPKVRNLMPEIFGAFFTAFSTLAIVAITPLKGRLGFAVTLIGMAIITSATISWIKRDSKAARNSVSTVFVYVAAAFVIIPLTSLLFEIIRKGAGGLSWGIFTRDMSLASASSPLTEGGVLHAVIGTLYVVSGRTIYC